MAEHARTLVMTGATSGIGAHALARLTAHPETRAIIGARPSSTRPALDGAELLPLDLSSLADVRTFAAAVLDHLGGEPIDMLVLNAGAQFRNTSARSADGFEMTFAVNHLAHYLLARLLLPAVAKGGRIVLTSSDTHDPKIFPRAETGRGPPLGADARFRLKRLRGLQTWGDQRQDWIPAGQVRRERPSADAHDQPNPALRGWRGRPSPRGSAPDQRRAEEEQPLAAGANARLGGPYARRRMAGSAP